jgi:hypothetical protein
MRDFLRFFLSAADQARVVPASVTVTDVGLSDPAGSAYQALRIGFTINNPAAGPPQLRPLFPGAMLYKAEPGSPGNLPDPADIVLTPAEYATWRTRGTLRIKLGDKKDTVVMAGIREHSPGLEVQPTIAWYSPVQLTETFMLTTLTSGLEKVEVGKSPAAKIKPTHPDWPKHAVSRFLQGTYEGARLRLGETATDDDVFVHAMPSVVMAADGKVTLTITIARTQPPQDGDATALDLVTPGFSRDDPRHAINAGIPARHVYRLVLAHLIDGDPTAPLADLVLRPWPQARRYFAFKITRTWQDVPNFSVLFPSRSAIVNYNTSTSSVDIVLPIPAHGVVYVWEDPATPPEPGPPVLSLISIQGPAITSTTFLNGATANSWKVKSGIDPVLLSTTSSSHVILRRPLSEEILADPVFPKPGGLRCTYMSLRRATRAFVDHRLTGGRLTHENKGKTSKVTQDLMTAAWNPTAANILLNGKPIPEASPAMARELEKIWLLFFPDDVPANEVDGTTNRTVVLNGGQMMYDLWQTIEDVLAANSTKCNFSNEHVGTGGPGAIVAVGLSSGFLTRPPHIDPSPTPDEMNNNVTEMLTRLTPGCVLQFWHTREKYQDERLRRGGDPNIYGHSPIFRAYMPSGPTGVPTGIIVVDQLGRDIKCPVQGDRITWHGDKQDIWIAAQWDD